MHLDRESVTRMVAEGYDKVSYAYRSDVDVPAHRTYGDWLKSILESIEPGSDVLDLGCGCGVPASQILAERFNLTGMDLSPVQIERAQRLVPTGHFLVGDITATSFSNEEFSAVVCPYAMIHVPSTDQRPLIESIYTWLKPQGLCVATVGKTHWTGTESDWLGVGGATMYWSHADAQTYRQWFDITGFVVLEDAYVPEGEGGHQRFLLKKPSARRSDDSVSGTEGVRTGSPD